MVWIRERAHQEERLVTPALVQVSDRAIGSSVDHAGEVDRAKPSKAMYLIAHPLFIERVFASSRTPLAAEL